ncbi:MAG: Arc family DNA-binding protein [Clostridia bacterium]|nr:Arc family DNA-binding protein [Clostridia bacterium]
MATNKVQTGIRFEPELLNKITYISKKNKRSLNAQLEFLAQSCVDEYEKENGEIIIDNENL